MRFPQFLVIKSGKKKKSELAKLQKEHDEKIEVINKLKKKREEMKLQLENKEFSEEKEEAFRKLNEKYQTIRVTYIVKGSCTVRVRSVEGIIVDRHIEAGESFLVPRLLNVLKIADPDGMEWLSIVTNEKPNSYFSLGFWGLLTEAYISRSSSSPGCS
ncbi:hypothetical protein K7X08_025442 [Anisodus acutangulus]|uniref:Uncharacterized protein n=1 Tax=Anisodus acutangulus TaxID=402998 RepID=A0A9Q1LWL7_9SOLA|nr:hypothetical protein K7X08_025442 [Anisodus acutangulus]